MLYTSKPTTVIRKLALEKSFLYPALIFFLCLFSSLILVNTTVSTQTVSAQSGTGEADCRDVYNRDSGGSEQPYVLGYEGEAAGLRKPSCGDDVEGASLAIFEWESGRQSTIEKPFTYGFTDDEGRHIFGFLSNFDAYTDEEREAEVARGNILILTDDLQVQVGGETYQADDPLGVLPSLTNAEQNDIGVPDNIADSVEGLEESPQSTCEDGGGMAWLFCQVLEVASSTLDFVDGRMVEILAMRDDFFENDDLRSSWLVLRNIAYAILVPAMLLMIISTALGFEFVSAYTVKSALPRMVIATIFIALSYELTTFFVDFVQTVGYGIHNILLYPFTETYDLDSTTTLVEVVPPPETFTAGTGLSGLAAWGAVAGGAAVKGGGLVATLAGFFGVAVLMLLAVLTLLLFRQTIIVLLVLISPIAIIAWIFPGRTTVWSIWNKTFWLMMWFFPIIMATTAAAKIMAVIIANTG